MRIVGGFLLVMMMLFLSTTSAPAGDSPRTWTVLTGGGMKDTAVVSNSFRPRTIEIAVGDTVKWEFQEPWTIHTVSFASGKEPPELEVREGGKFYINAEVFFPTGPKTYDGTGYRNSGIAPQGPGAKHFTYSLTFTKAGTYKYLCIVHGPDMWGEVIVRDRVSASPTSAAARGRSDFAATLKAGQAALAKWNPERQGDQIVLPLVGDAKSGWSILRFSREPLVIKRGTTVTWDMRDTLEGHTVTFLGGKKPPDFLIIEPQKGGRPKVLENPTAMDPTQTKTFDGTGFRNSGEMLAPGTPGNPVTKYSLTFTKPGRYEYWCIIHAPWGMKGTVVVQ